MSDLQDGEMPKATKGDLAHLVVKSALSAVPGLGGPAAELFNAVIAPPLAKRKDVWMIDVAAGLRALEVKVDGFSIEALAKDEKFITAVMHASTTAVKNHQREKLDALRNAVLNSSLPGSPDGDIQLMFLRLVDTLTPLHIRLLALLADPKAWGERNGVKWPSVAMGGIGSVIIEHGLPELKGKRELYDKVGRDLHNEGLLGPATFHVTTSPLGLFAAQTTDLGNQFLKFIASPV